MVQPFYIDQLLLLLKISVLLRFFATLALSLQIPSARRFFL